MHVIVAGRGVTYGTIHLPLAIFDALQREGYEASLVIPELPGNSSRTVGLYKSLQTNVLLSRPLMYLEDVIRSNRLSLAVDRQRSLRDYYELIDREGRGNVIIATHPTLVLDEKPQGSTVIYVESQDLTLRPETHRVLTRENIDKLVVPNKELAERAQGLYKGDIITGTFCSSILTDPAFEVERNPNEIFLNLPTYGYFRGYLSQILRGLKHPIENGEMSLHISATHPSVDFVVKRLLESRDSIEFREDTPYGNVSLLHCKDPSNLEAVSFFLDQVNYARRACIIIGPPNEGAILNGYAGQVQIVIPGRSKIEMENGRVMKRCGVGIELKDPEDISDAISQVKRASVDSLRRMFPGFVKPKDKDELHEAAVPLLTVYDILDGFV